MGFLLEENTHREIGARGPSHRADKITGATEWEIGDRETLYRVNKIAGASEWEIGARETLYEIQSQLHEYTPPGIYLIDRDTVKYLFIEEAYRAPLKPHIFEFGYPDIYIYYKEWRSLDYIEEDAEFQRCIFFEYYNPEYMIL